jgi:hypothetical protein
VLFSGPSREGLFFGQQKAAQTAAFQVQRISRHSLPLAPAVQAVYMV